MHTAWSQARVQDYANHLQHIVAENVRLKGELASCREECVHLRDKNWRLHNENWRLERERRGLLNALRGIYEAMRQHRAHKVLL